MFFCGTKLISKFIVNIKIYDFFNLLKSKYDTNKKKYELKIIMAEEWAQDIFDELIKRNENYVYNFSKIKLN